MITKDPDLLKKLAYMRNFGFNGPEAFAELGINGKNSEFHAAMGLANLTHINGIIEKRKCLSEYYEEKLKTVRCTFQVWNSNATRNYGYFPMICESQMMLKKWVSILQLHEIFPRRYFYPSLSKVLPYVQKNDFEITDEISRKVLCLPLYYDLSFEEVELIVRLLLRAQNN